MDEEKIIIGGWLLGYHLDDMARLEPSDFTSCRDIVGAMKDVGTDTFRISRKLNIPITDLAEMTAMYQPYLYGSAVRQMIETKAKTYLAQVPGDTPVSQIADRLTEFAEAMNIGSLPKSAENLAGGYLEEIDRRMKEKPVRWMLPSLDYYMGGIRTKELTTVGARPSVGKSAFLLQAAQAIARQDKKVIYLPLEMSTMQTVERMVQSKGGISQERLRRGKLTDEEWGELSIRLDDVREVEKGKNFLLFEGCSNLAAIRQLVRVHKPFAVVIDQLTQLTDDRKFRDKREQFSFMTNNLKRIAMSEGVAVLLAAQVNRSAQQSEPTMANLKESGSIEEDSDNIILLHEIPLEQLEDTTGWDDTNRPVLVKVEKQRDGRTGSIKTCFRADRFTFYDLERSSDE